MSDEEITFSNRLKKIKTVYEKHLKYLEKNKIPKKEIGKKVEKTRKNSSLDSNSNLNSIYGLDYEPEFDDKDNRDDLKHSNRESEKKIEKKEKRRRKDTIRDKESRDSKSETKKNEYSNIKKAPITKKALNAYQIFVKAESLKEKYKKIPANKRMILIAEEWDKKKDIKKNNKK